MRVRHDDALPSSVDAFFAGGSGPVKAVEVERLRRSVAVRRVSR
jgi:hypothetical protein